jgi:putative ABC transport system permease protein
MFALRLIGGSFVRQKQRKLVAVLSIALGTAVAVALLAVSLDVGDRINRELRAFGANLVVMPATADLPLKIAGADVASLAAGERYLDDRSLSALDKIFWTHNILGYTPYLSVPDAQVNGQNVTLVGTWFEHGNKHLGVRADSKAWQIQGAWPHEPGEGFTSSGGDRFFAATAAQLQQKSGHPSDDVDAPAEALVGGSLAARLRVVPGSILKVLVGSRILPLRVSGLVTTGGDEDNQLIAPLESAQALLGQPHAMSEVRVSALTTPEINIYEKYHKDPRKMPAADFERWYCTPYASSIALQVQEAIPNSRCSVVRRISATEGALLDKLEVLFVTLGLLAIAGAAMAVTGTLSTTMLERSNEVGLLKALGCSNQSVVLLFLAEGVVLGLLGGLLGGIAGMGLARLAGHLLFGTVLPFNVLLIPTALVLAVSIAVLGSVVQVQALVRLQPAEVLRA